MPNLEIIHSDGFLKSQVPLTPCRLQTSNQFVQPCSQGTGKMTPSYLGADFHRNATIAKAIRMHIVFF